MNEDFNVEFKRRLFLLQDCIEQYRQGILPAAAVFPALYRCASYCWCHYPLKNVKK